MVTELHKKSSGTSRRGEADKTKRQRGKYKVSINSCLHTTQLCEVSCSTSAAPHLCIFPNSIDLTVHTMVSGVTEDDPICGALFEAERYRALRRWDGLYPWDVRPEARESIGEDSGD